MLSDVLPTGFDRGVLNDKVQPGSTVTSSARDRAVLLHS